MNELFQMVLNGRTVEQMLVEEAQAIRLIGSSGRKTFAQKKSHGFVTGKIIPVLAARRS